nr:nucleoside monophosphate kinase [Brachyspira hyodysenteriae]
MLDGFPRTIEQAKELSNILESLNYKISAVIDIFASEEIIIDRLLKRVRADDNEETIKNRLKVFENQSKPVLDYYSDKAKIIKIESIATLKKYMLK